MGNPTGDSQAVPLFERGVAPVEFAPPEDLRPGQVGTIVDEQANTLDVTATIVDLAVRGYLTIEEIRRRGGSASRTGRCTARTRPTAICSRTSGRC